MLPEKTYSARQLWSRYSLNPKTVRKWRQRTHVSDRRMGLKDPSSTSLLELEEAAAVTFRRITYQRFIPQLKRSSLHRLYQHHGISQLPRQSADKQQSNIPFNPYPVGYLHMDICGIRIGEDKASWLVAVDRTSKFVFAWL